LLYWSHGKANKQKHPYTKKTGSLWQSAIKNPTGYRMPNSVFISIGEFIPPHLVEHIVLTGEVTRLFDMFGQQHIKEGKFPAGAIDSVWTDEIKQDFRNWAKSNPDKLPM
jgi:hypothetical protein